MGDFKDICDVSADIWINATPRKVVSIEALECSAIEEGLYWELMPCYKALV